MKKFTSLFYLLLIFTSLLMSGCGGGGGFALPPLSVLILTVSRKLTEQRQLTIFQHSTERLQVGMFYNEDANQDARVFIEIVVPVGTTLLRT